MKAHAKSTDLYRLIHDRLRAAYGRADSHDCACGCGQRAKDWALKPNPVGETFPWCRDGGLVYLSLLLTDYQPMGRKCHLSMDAATRRRQALVEQGQRDYEDYGDGYLGYRAVAQPTLDDGTWTTA